MQGTIETEARLPTSLKRGRANQASPGARDRPDWPGRVSSWLELLLKRLLACTGSIGVQSPDPDGTGRSICGGGSSLWKGSSSRRGRAPRRSVARTLPDELYHLAGAVVRPRPSGSGGARTLAAIAGSTAASCWRPSATTAASTKVFVAGSGAMFGAAPESPQREVSRAGPRRLTRRRAGRARGRLAGFADATACCACLWILTNHERERRRELFVTRRPRRRSAIKPVCARRFHSGRDRGPRLVICRGRDAGRAMSQQGSPDDYILASGVGHTVAEFAECAFACVGLRAEDHVNVEAALRRPSEPTPRVGDPTKAHLRLDWHPEALVRAARPADGQCRPECPRLTPRWRRGHRSRQRGRTSSW